LVSGPDAGRRALGLHVFCAIHLAAEVGNMFINTMLVAAGVGGSVAPASMAESHAGLVDYLPLRGSARFTAPLTLALHGEGTNPAVASFCSVAREVAK
jgi:DNA-binding transcriptional LysR family regulator